jgi:hypothetical protein
LHPGPNLPPLQGVGRRQLEIPIEDLRHLLSECHTIIIQTVSESRACPARGRGSAHGAHAP